LISGRNAQCVNVRAKELGITHVIQDSKDKIKDLDSILAQLGSTPEQTVFVGDDLGDLPVMQHVGYAIAVNNAADEVKQISDWVTPRDGGQGAVRDAIEYIMKSNGSWQIAIETINISTPQQ
jgi:3-deoxy-D-manno-octulosonate 8-phosphate phosphatase (KDO 8-P phosphatase)